MEKEDPDFVFKVLLLGEASVGKTSLTNRYVKSEFSSNYSVTLCLDVMRKVVTIGKQKCSLQIWDTVGQEKYRTITSSFYKGSKGIVLVFSVTQRHSFETMQVWIDSILEYADLSTLSLVLVGNKADLHTERQVSREEAEELARRLKVQYFETSAKEGTGVETAFVALCTDMIAKETAVQQKAKSSGGGSGETRAIEKGGQLPTDLNNADLLKKPKKRGRLPC